jgi:hypothetical protein
MAIVPHEVNLCLDETVRAFIYCRRADELNQQEKNDLIWTVSKDPAFVCMDFSNIGLSKNELKTLFSGLVAREQEIQLTKMGYSLQLLNISSEHYSYEDLKEFLQKLQRGETVNGKKIYPDVRQTAIVVGFPISQEFYIDLTEVAPSVFAGGLKLLC